MKAQSLRPMSLGEILDRSFQIYRGNFGLMFATAALPFLLMAVLYALAGVPMAVGNAEAGILALMLVTAGAGLATLVVWAALAHQVNGAVAGERVPVGEGLRRGLRALLSLIGFGILAYLLLLGVMLPFAMIAGFGAAFGVPGLIVGTLIGVAIGGLLLVWWGSMIFITVPAIVAERIGPYTGMKRAASLAKGGRLRIIVAAVVSWIVVTLPVLGAYMILGTTAALYDPAAMMTMSSTQLFLQQLVAFGSGALTTPYLVAVSVLTYYDRRLRREAYDVELATGQLVTSS